MFDLGWTELLLIGIVALIVVGPKDLPQLFRGIGRFMGKARTMARDFSRAMNEAADEAGVSEINKTIKAAADPKGFGLDKLKQARAAAGLSDPPGSETSKPAERSPAMDKILDEMGPADQDPASPPQSKPERVPADLADPAPAASEPPKEAGK